MPSFAFWKSSKQDESKSPLLTDAAVAEELRAIVPGASKAVDLNPGNQDAGVFLFDDDAQEIPVDHTTVIGPVTETHNEAAQESVSLLDVEESTPRSNTPSLMPEEPKQIVEVIDGTSQPESLPTTPSMTSTSVADGTGQEDSHSSSRPASLVPRESGPSLSVEKRAVGGVDTNMRDRDSGVYMSDSEDSPTQSKPSKHIIARARVSSLSEPTVASPHRTNSIARLQRPAELNLGFSSASNAAKPRSELDLRYDLIRNSKTQSKAALRSPTQLLQERLNMSPKKDVEEKIRVFTPPRATVNGCMLPGPGAQTAAFTSTSVRAQTEGGRPAWWCKVDKLVVFDGIGNSEMSFRTRTSKGLSIARRLGDLETVVIPLNCAHCHEMLNRHEWKYNMRVCQRSVCWDCKERCKWEDEQERAATPRTDVNRERADSVLQDEHSRSQGRGKAVGVEA